MNFSKQKTLLLSLICICKLSLAQFTGFSPIQQASSGNVAIGFPAYTPTALLQVRNGSVLFDGTTGVTPISGTGTRMMWIPSKNAFRAGQVTGNQWDDANVGTYSVAFGYNTKAVGTRAFAIGYYAQASGNASVAIGTSVNANGTYSFATGTNTITAGDLSSAFGNYSVASSYNSFVLGQYNYNPGYNTTTWVNTDPLFVIGNGTSLTATSNAMTVLKNGNVGIGTVSPPSKLAIIGGQTKISGFSINSGNVHTCIYNQPGATNAGVIQVYYNTTWNPNDIGSNPYMLQLQPEGGNVGIGLNSSNPTERLDVNGNARINGNVFIGPQKITSGPHANDSRLTVDGKIVVKAIYVTTDNWADYVFSDNYKLPNLREVENFYTANKHLCEIPTEKEIIENGVNLSEMNTLLLKKVEELTLYLVQQNLEYP